MRYLLALVSVALMSSMPAPAYALERPWISDVYFYWYQWDYQKRTGNWLGGVYNTPLYGYYDSRKFADNYRSLHTASEWGITHHFMDFWGHPWADEKGRPREQVVMDAAEALRRRGYDIWMSYYQDGWDFQMDDFPRNLDDGRAVDGWLRRYAKSPAWPKIAGKPVQLVYGRNGVPKITATDDGFRQWLKDKYGSLQRLRAQWRRDDITHWSQVRWNPNALGVERADAILYQYELWQKSWAELNRRVREKYGFPGMIASFDIAYEPFRGWGFSLQTKTFCGPHSYGGIFGQPNDRDPQRFIQAAVAKWYGTVFFDTFKNFYHDWEIRYPGFCYPPEPAHFDRFWAVALAHYAEALLHLSWNEWWEGSNLEPSRQWGKTFCEKNLLYATVMKACFPSIRRAQKTGEVAVLLNDWHWLASGVHPGDIYNTIQALRAASVDFKLLPDDFVTLEDLRDVRLVVAPTGLTGLGHNARGQAIADVLWRWLRGDKQRRLLIGYLPSADELPSDCSQVMRDRLGLRPAKLSVKAAPQTVNAFIDVGQKGDEQFIISGRSHREDWSRLPETAFGKRRRRHTVRWCPGTGDTTRVLVPLAPEKPHILTIAGDAVWPNEVRVTLDGQQIGRLEIRPGSHQYQLTIPAAAARRPFAELALRFEHARIPAVETKGQNKDRRVCDLAIDWIHIRTPDQPADRRVAAKPPAATLAFHGLLAALGREKLPLRPLHPVTADGAEILSRYQPLGLARDMLLDGGRVWYCHGLLGDVTNPGYWQRVLQWASVKPRWLVRADGVIGARLSADQTDVLVAYNTDITKEVTAVLRPAAHDWPLAEARVISRDGKAFAPAADLSRGRDTFRYYSVYQFAFCPVRPTLVRPAGLDKQKPWPTILPGMTGRLPVRLTNLTGHPVSGTITVESFLPSLTAKAVHFSLGPHKKTTVDVPLTARDDLDWGRKTVCIVVEVGGRRTYFWRPLYVAVEPPFSATLQWRGPGFGLGLVVPPPPPKPWAIYPPIQDLTLRLNGKTVARFPGIPRFPDWGFIGPAEVLGGRRQVALEIGYTVLGSRHTQLLTVPVQHPDGPAVTAPPDARAALAFSAGPCPVPRVVCADGFRLPAGTLEVRDARARRAIVGRWRVEDVSEGNFQGLRIVVPGKVTGPLFLCPAEAASRTDLRVQKLPDGRLRVRNSELLAVFDPAKGGTITELRWRAGRNMADRSFGASWGRWGKYDPLAPRISADKFLAQERKHYQWQAPAKVTVVDRSPAHVTVLVDQQRPLFTIHQRYCFFAMTPYLQVASTVRARKDVDLRKLDIEEIVPLDVRLRRGPWTKIYPNFTGRHFGDQPRFHDAWREGPCLPPVATVFDQRTYRPSLSLLFEPGRTSDARLYKFSFRQGFFPEQRGKPGIPDTVRLEVVRRCGPSIAAPWATWPVPRLRKGRWISVCATVLLHDGGYAFAEDVAAAKPIIFAPTYARITARAGRVPSQPPADWWWDSYNVRTPVTQPLTAHALTVGWLLRVGNRWIDPSSIRAVWQGSDGPQVLQAAVTVSGGRTARVVIEPPQIPLGSGRLYLYGRLTDRPPAKPEEIKAGLPNPSFEEEARGWSFSGAALDNSEAHSGRASVKLQAPQGAYSLVQTNAVDVLPASRYKVSLWAKTSAAGATVIANFYINGQYDFPHIRVQLKADGKWHRYELEVPTGQYPPVARPALRIWVYHHPAPVWIDDVAVKALEGPPPARLVGPTQRLR